MKFFPPAAASVSLLTILWSPPVAAGMADVIAAAITPEARSGGGSSHGFSATIRHADTGWDHYADAFEILAPDGTVLGTRILAHPHENEQPFTRSLGGVVVPENVFQVIVRAHDSVHGYGGETVTITLPKR